MTRPIRDSIENEITDSMKCCVWMNGDWCQGGCSAERIYLRNEGIYREEGRGPQASFVLEALYQVAIVLCRLCVMSVLCYVDFVPIPEEATD